MTKIILKQTSPSHPEQYDATYNDKVVGYLRLRGGLFTVHYPDIDGELIYSARAAGDNSFEDYERDLYLSGACMAIIKNIGVMYCGFSKQNKPKIGDNS